MHGTPPAPPPSGSAFSPRRVGLVVGLVLVAAAIATVVFVRLHAKPPTWRLLDADGVTTVDVDGNAVPTAELLRASIPSGSHLRTGNAGEIRIGIPGMAEVALAPNTEITLGSSKGGIEGNLPAVTLHRGALRGEPTPQFHGLWVESYTASTLLQGAPAAVAVHHDTLEVSSTRGGADVIAKTSGEMAHVPPGGRLTMVGAENPTVIEPSPEGEPPPGAVLPESTRTEPGGP